jgi:hypothetical protein
MFIRMRVKKATVTIDDVLRRPDDPNRGVTVWRTAAGWIGGHHGFVADQCKCLGFIRRVEADGVEVGAALSGRGRGTGTVISFEEG